MTVFTVCFSHLKLMTSRCTTDIFSFKSGVKDACHSRKILPNDIHMLIKSLIANPASVGIYNLVKHLRLDLT
jgi:hypothetical protein